MLPRIGLPCVKLSVEVLLKGDGESFLTGTGSLDWRAALWVVSAVLDGTPGVPGPANRDMNVCIHDCVC